MKQCRTAEQRPRSKRRVYKSEEAVSAALRADIRRFVIENELRNPRDRKSLGKRHREFREMIGLSVSTAARFLGIQERTVFAWERDGLPPGPMWILFRGMFAHRESIDFGQSFGPVAKGVVRAVRQAIGVTTGTFATMLHVDRRTIARWESASDTVRGPARTLFALLVRNPDRWDSFFGNEAPLSLAEVVHRLAYDR